MRVALVYPPYGPLNLPSLGMAILSAGVKARGFECRTFYWNYQLLEALPQPRREQRRLAYGMLSERSLFPWNEWAFTRYALPAVAHRDDEALARQRMLDETGPPAGGMPPSQLLRHIVEIAPRLVAQMTRQLAPFDVVGIGSTFFQNGAALALARAVKARWPEKLVVLGGANCDGEMGRAQIEAFPFLDCVFVGEVDHAFPEMVERLAGGRPIADTPGILCRGADGAIREGPPSPPLTDLDALPVPDFDDYVAERKRFGLHVEGELCLPLESSRGCWWGAKHHCTFCGLNANGMAFRQKDPERFRREVQETVLRYGARWLFMADNILSAKYYRDFVQWAKQRQLRLDFFYEIKANVTRRQVADLAEAGITMVQPGIESFSSATLKLMRKGVRGIQNVAFLKYCAEHGLIAAYNLLAGFPGEDPFEYERMAQQLPKLFHLRPPNGLSVVEFHRFSPYHNDPASFGLRLRPHENYGFIYPLPEHELARLAYFFDLEGRAPSDLSYLMPMRSMIDAWRAQFDEARCALTWRREGEDILVRDRRPGFGPRDIRLQGEAVSLLEALDAPTSLEAALRALYGSVRAAPPAQDVRTQAGERVIAFKETELRADPAACLRELLAPGLVYEEAGLYVSLPVNAAARPAEAGWARIVA